VGYYGINAMSRDSKYVGTRDCLAVRESNERTDGPARGEGSVSSSVGG
jgi:hypothetical protein